MHPRGVVILHTAVVVTSAGLVAFLLSSQGDLRSHNALSFGNEAAVRAGAVAPLAEALVPFEDGDHAVVSTAGAFGRALRHGTNWRHLSWLRLADVLKGNRTSPVADSICHGPARIHRLNIMLTCWATMNE